MYVKRKVYVELTSEEREILKNARDILQEFENFSSSEQDNDLQELYENYLEYNTHDYALPTAIDLISMIIEKGEEDDEI